MFGSGCYISKCVYYRTGEKSLDCYYRPYHRVEYYRYIRFFPEGKISNDFCLQDVTIAVVYITVQLARYVTSSVD